MGTARAWRQGFEDADEAKNLDLAAGLFQEFASQRRLDRFAEIHLTAGYRPVAFIGLAAPLDEENVVALENDAADGEDGTLLAQGRPP